MVADTIDGSGAVDSTGDLTHKVDAFNFRYGFVMRFSFMYSFIRFLKTKLGFPTYVSHKPFLVSSPATGWRFTLRDRVILKLFSGS